MARKKATAAAVEEKKEFSAEPVVGTVDVKSLLNVREGAGKEYPVKTVLLAGAKVNIIGESGEWWQVPDGWVMKKFIVIADE